MDIDFNKLQVEADDIYRKLKEISDFDLYLKQCGLPENEAVIKYFDILETNHKRLEEITEILEKSLEVE